MSLKGFDKRIAAITDGIRTNTLDVVRKCALAVDATVVLATPVDTGRARSNWIVTIGSASDTSIAPYSPGSKGSSAGANSQAAIDQAKAVIAGYQLGKTIHITNNLHYIGKLNDGYSAQAPANFVIQAAEAGLQTVRNAKLIK